MAAYFVLSIWITFVIFSWMPWNLRIYWNCPFSCVIQTEDIAANLILSLIFYYWHNQELYIEGQTTPHAAIHQGKAGGNVRISYRFQRRSAGLGICQELSCPLTDAGAANPRGLPDFHLRFSQRGRQTSVLPPQSLPRGRGRCVPLSITIHSAQRYRWIIININKASRTSWSQCQVICVPSPRRKLEWDRELRLTY